MHYPPTITPAPPSGWPKISVVVPSFNQGKFLGATLDSILSQNYPNLECIVVDGGSTDNSVDIIRSVSDRLTWWCSEKDKGHANALNKGFAHATGDVMCWLNSDDLFAPWCLWIIGDVFARFPQMEWLTGNYGIWDAHGRLITTRSGGGCLKTYLAHKDFNIQQESTFWRRSLWTRAGARINESYRLMIDAELWLRFFRHARLHSLNTLVSGYRWHGENRALSHADQVIQERWRAIKEHASDLSWAVRMLIKMGPEPSEYPPGLRQWLRRKIRKRIREQLLKFLDGKSPSIRWDHTSCLWELVPAKSLQKQKKPPA